MAEACRPFDGCDRAVRSRLPSTRRIWFAREVVDGVALFEGERFARDDDVDLVGVGVLGHVVTLSSRNTEVDQRLGSIVDQLVRVTAGCEGHEVTWTDRLGFVLRSHLPRPGEYKDGLVGEEGAVHRERLLPRG